MDMAITVASQGQRLVGITHGRVGRRDLIVFRGSWWRSAEEQARAIYGGGGAREAAVGGHRGGRGGRESDVGTAEQWRWELDGVLGA